jgi:hypothetical protein
VLYGTPINQPGQVVDGNMEGVPGASYDEHEHQKIERRNASENYLMTKFRRKVRSQELGASKDLGR